MEGTVEMVVVADTVPFASLCETLDAMQKKPKCGKRGVLEAFIDKFKMDAFRVPGKKNTTFYPILRLLLPQLERDRGAYNMKKKKLADRLISALSLSKHSSEAKKLADPATDLVAAAYFVVKNLVGTLTSTLTVGEVNGVLDRIASAEVGNKGPVINEEFRYVFNGLTAENIRWFLKIILKDMKLGIGHNSVLAAFHPDAPEHYDTYGNLSKVCEELEDGNTRPLELGIQVYFAISPMLSERLDVTDTAQLPTNCTYQIENKFDGERFQIHMENGVFEYFSRRGYSFSNNFGKSYDDDAGLHTPKLRDCFNSEVKSFILDGEMMGWNKELQCFGSKGMAFDVKKLTRNSKFSPCFCAFDLLYYNGRALIGPPEKGGLRLKERLQILDDMFQDIHGVIYHSERRIVQNSSDILDALNKAIDNEEEGIVVKDVDSYYIPRNRKSGWYKIKPEYTEGAMTDLDLVVIGADKAEQRKHGDAKSFMVACVDRSGADTRWVSVGRVSTGLTYEERERVCETLKANWVEMERTPPPDCLVFNREKPHYWVSPEKSVVFEVRATELIRSKEFGAPYTLRFPRVVRLREDKPVDDAYTLQALLSLVKDRNPVEKLGKTRIERGQSGAPAAKVRKKRSVRTLRVASQFKVPAEPKAKVVSKALEGRRICILSEDRECTKTQLVRIIESHGGKHVENFGPNTWCCVAGIQTYRVKQLIKSGDLDIASTTWLRTLPNAAAPCELTPLDMLAISTRTKLIFGRRYDSYGDSYTRPIDVMTLKSCFERIAKEEPEIYLTNREILMLDEELFADDSPLAFLRGCFLHMPRGGATIEAMKAKFYGAVLCPSTEAPTLTHVVLSEDDEDLRRSLHELQMNDNVFVVTVNWLVDCLEKRKWLPECDYDLKSIT